MSIPLAITNDDDAALVLKEPNCLLEFFTQHTTDAYIHIHIAMRNQVTCASGEVLEHSMYCV